MSDKTDPRLEQMTDVIVASALGHTVIASDRLARLDAAARDAGYVPMLDTNDEALRRKVSAAIADWIHGLTGEVLAALREAS